ncbi:class I SAM-dependent methyltransferase [Candidatus Amarolinea aalborgensis]|jgi:SAM-dependent methyltransferase|uniref:class I SAM-dependent methyltransferase n=1 Tax=Candidatus Amarolinea aalborgensis TaxID=2249329 RepID=UPI003BF9560F
MEKKQKNLLTRGRRMAGRWKGALMSQMKAGVYALAYRGLLPATWRQRLIAQFWENNAAAIHAQWGSGRGDHAVLGEVLKRYAPVSLLDAGCGSGRLFSLYQECGVRYIVGTDISEAALEIARNDFPGIDLQCVSLQDLTFADNTFDFCVCNRVLQHVPPQDICAVVANLARISQWVYVNELTQSDDMAQAFFMRMHDYEALFGEAGMIPVENGLIGKQTYTMFGRGELPAERA